MADSITLVDGAEQAHAALSPRRIDILRALDEPKSATEVAGDLGLTRQQVNYHLTILAEHDLIAETATRRRRGFVERVYRRSGRLVFDPSLAQPDVAGSGPASDAVIGAAADTIRAIAELRSASHAEGTTLATATVVSNATFGRPSDLQAFLADLASLIARYDKPDEKRGRRMRLTLLAHPEPPNA